MCLLQLFDHIASCIAEFLDELRLKHEHFTLGFTFSFPCQQRGLASATLVKWTKGFKCSGVENEDVVSLLHQAIERRQVRYTRHCLLTDSPPTAITRDASRSFSSQHNQTLSSYSEFLNVIRLQS